MLGLPIPLSVQPIVVPALMLVAPELCRYKTPVALSDVSRLQSLVQSPGKPTEGSVALLTAALQAPLVGCCELEDASVRQAMRIPLISPWVAVFMLNL
ncbi:MAG: hypothetical protein BWY68_00911 [bacterium ADurb.Bin400]|nr:MAG: hypothetical protein BWY68_00911 [bacterium ADurb.Bin400]